MIPEDPIEQDLFGVAILENADLMPAVHSGKIRPVKGELLLLCCHTTCQLSLLQTLQPACTRMSNENPEVSEQGIWHLTFELHKCHDCQLADQQKSSLPRPHTASRFSGSSAYYKTRSD